MELPDAPAYPNMADESPGLEQDTDRDTAGKSGEARDTDDENESICADCQSIPLEILCEPFYQWTEAGYRPTVRDLKTEDNTLKKISRESIIRQVLYDLTPEEQELSDILNYLKGPESCEEYLIRTVPFPFRWPDKSQCKICRLLQQVLPYRELDVSEMVLQQCASSKNNVPLTSLLRLAVASDTELDQGSDMLTTCLDSKTARYNLRHLVPFHIDYERIRSAITECQSLHGKACCTTNSDNLRNLKVIDCEQRLVVPAPIACQFTAISYVWGPSTHQPAEKLLVAGGQHLPTIEDSITVTLQLGYKYIWVDRYCIDQSDSEEVRDQVMQMADIYAAAQVTLIAAAKFNAWNGLPGVSNPRSYLGAVRGVSIFACPPVSGVSRLLNCSWSRRAWTFQECYFSKRRLFFSEDQVVLHCNQKSQFEDSSVLHQQQRPKHHGQFIHRMQECTPGPLIIDRADTLGRDLHMERILNILSSYSGRDLSFERDALNAVLGTLTTFRQHGIDHCWGVPFRSITPEEERFCSSGDVAIDRIALLWISVFPFRRREGFPRWSPLGWAGGILWFWRYRQQDDGYITPFPPYSVLSDQTCEPLVAEGGGIQNHHHQGYTKSIVRDGLRGNLETAMNPSQLIESTGLTVVLRLGPALLFDRFYGRNVATVSLSLTSEIDLLFLTYWDANSNRPMANKGLLFTNADKSGQEGPTKMTEENFLMIVRPQSGHYERVGILHLPLDLISCSQSSLPNNIINMSTPVCRFHFHHTANESFLEDHASGPSLKRSDKHQDRVDSEKRGSSEARDVTSIDLEGNEGADTSVEGRQVSDDEPVALLQPSDELSFDRVAETLNFVHRPEAEALDVSHLELTSKDWWRQYFKTETIILG